MNFNQNSGYGQAVMAGVSRGLAKAHIVAQTSTTYAALVAKLQDLYNVDPDGQVMFHLNSSTSNGFNAAIDACNTGHGDIIIVAPGFYWIAETIAMDKNDVTLVSSEYLLDGKVTPESTVIFGTGTYGSVVASTFDCITVTGVNCRVLGLGGYTHKDDKAFIKFDDAGGAATAGFNLVDRCYASPQAADGMGYGVQFAGGSVNHITNCIFEAVKTAGILLTGSVGNPARTLIKDNEFIGTGDQGIHITSANYQTRITGNTFTPGSQSGYNLAKGIIITAGMNAGDVMYANNVFNLASGDVITDGGSGTVNGSTTLGNVSLA